VAADLAGRAGHAQVPGVGVLAVDALALVEVDEVAPVGRWDGGLRQLHGVTVPYPPPPPEAQRQIGSSWRSTEVSGGNLRSPRSGSQVATSRSRLWTSATGQRTVRVISRKIAQAISSCISSSEAGRRVVQTSW